MFDSLQRLYMIDGSTSYRVSSWDKSGGNADFLVLQPGEACNLAELQGPGCIRHVYCTMIDPSRLFYRKAVLRMVHQERFEDACDEYDGVLRLLTTMVKRLEAK
jgi:hypothetical protein